MQVLGKGHTIRGLEKCDFTPIYEHFMGKKEAEKARTKEVGHPSLLTVANHGWPGWI